ncbi:MAG: hypothetical protein ACR2PT_24135 [Endozoicomonas sp.]
MRISLLPGMATLFLLLNPVIAQGLPDGRVHGHRFLLAAMKNNYPPTGYLDLNNCRMTKNISDMPADRRTYRVSFMNNYSYDPDSGEITTLMDIMYHRTKEMGSTPVLMSRPATTILTAKPKTEFMTYQIVMTLNGKTMMQLYHCPWEGSVYLWKRQAGRLKF